MKSSRAAPRQPEPRRVTIWLRGGAALRLDAIAWYLWLRGDRSHAPKPSQTEAIRVLLVEPERVADVRAVEVFLCKKCGRSYGAPYCWEHHETAMVPTTPPSTTVSEE